MTRQAIKSGIGKFFITAIATLQLIACGGSDGGGSSTTGISGSAVDTAPASNTVSVASAVEIGGSIGDGPVIGATVDAYNNAGQKVGTVQSDNTATFKTSFKVKGKEYPLLLEVSGGTDLVTGTVPDFQMVSVMLNPSYKQVNINPFTMLAVKVAELMPGGISDSNLSTALGYVTDKLGFGLDLNLVPDPVQTEITNSNVANLVKASEALGEMIRRTRDLISTSQMPVNGDDVVAALAADLVDGRTDGVGAAGVNPSISAVANVVSGQVLVEAMSNNLKVGGVVATFVIDQAITITRADIIDSQLTGSVRVTSAMLKQARVSLKAAKVLDSSDEVISLSSKVENIAVGVLPDEVATVLPVEASRSLDNAVTLSTTADADAISTINLIVRTDGEAGGTVPVNSAPAISGIPAPSVLVGSNYSFQPSATDADGDVLTFNINGMPGWASFNSKTGQLTGTPGDSEVGVYDGIAISVTDGTASASLPAFAIQVDSAGDNTPVNNAPVISGTPAESVVSGSDYSFQPNATDVDGDILVFSINYIPGWASFDSRTGYLTGTPGDGDVGTYENIVISVSDGLAATSLGAFSIRVDAAVPDSPPASFSIGNTVPSRYIWSKLAVGELTYIDRDYTFTYIPAEFAGLDYLRTANDDKLSNGSAYISFDINQDAIVYVGIDFRNNPLPAWMGDWVNTGKQISGETDFLIYGKEFAAGTVTLGGNEAEFSMYTVMVQSKDGSVIPPTVPVPTISFTADSTVVAYAGSVSLGWASTDATSCSASGSWSGGKGLSGTEVVGPLTADVNYTLTCTGEGGQAQQSVAIKVSSPPAETPTVALAANPSSVDSNNATMLNWSASNADSCMASGGWSGSKGTSGSESSGILTVDTTFTLVCNGTGGSASQSVTVTVAPPSTPVVTLAATPSLVAFNEPTTLSWSVANADSCTASGGWSGSKGTSGSESSGALIADTMFVLDCTGNGGNASESVTVNVQQAMGSVNLSWTPPTTNEDGSTLVDLAGYYIYYGNLPGIHSNKITLNNPGIATYLVDNLLPGTYYFTVTAFDTSGNESRFSNEAGITIN